MVVSLKATVQEIQKASKQDVASGLHGSQVQTTLMDECLIFRRLLRNGMKCFSSYSKAPIPHTSEEKVRYLNYTT